MAFLTIVTRVRAITRDTVSPANRGDPGVGNTSQGVAGVVSDVSVLCPRAVDRSDNSLGPAAVAVGSSTFGDRWKVSSCAGLARRP